MNKDKRGILEIVVLAILTVSLIVVNIFHEPWFDEAQAWQIARCASLKDIMFYVPHYEGHPAFWYLLLMIPAKLGFPYEASLNVIACIAPIITGILILFKSPFPKLIRCLLPFQYFFFYQYGVIARPYGYMVLALMLMAMFFKNKKEHPWRFVLSMLFLCLLGGYGIILSCGICVAWLIDICIEMRDKLFSASFWIGSRVKALAFLLICNILIVLQIMPFKDAIGRNVKANNTLLERLTYTFFAMLPDGVLTNVFDEGKYLKSYEFTTASLLTAAIVGAVMLLVLILLSDKKHICYLLIPYVLFALFSANVYLYAHHIGILYAFIIFWLWCVFESKNEKIYLWIIKKLETKIKGKDAHLLKVLGQSLLVGLMIVPVFWSAVASWNDIKLPYFWGRETANFIKENGLESKTIMSIWDEDNICEMWYPVTILPYFDDMICMNLNSGDPKKAYVEYRTPSKEEERKILDEWRLKGYPDITIGSVNFRKIYGEETDLPEYQPIFKITPLWTCIWKNKIIASNYYSSTQLYGTR